MRGVDNTMNYVITQKTDTGIFKELITAAKETIATNILLGRSFAMERTRRGVCDLLRWRILSRFFLYIDPRWQQIMWERLI
jgi:hypothetical protein